LTAMMGRLQPSNGQRSYLFELVTGSLSARIALKRVSNASRSSANVRWACPVMQEMVTPGTQMHSLTSLWMSKVRYVTLFLQVDKLYTWRSRVFPEAKQCVLVTGCSGTTTYPGRVVPGMQMHSMSLASQPSSPIFLKVSWQTIRAELSRCDSQCMQKGLRH
jgi:hypothetical protein